MDLLVAWLAFPLLFAALTSGAGLLVERGAGYRLPGALVPAVGFTLIVGVSQTLTRVSAIAPVTPFVVLVLAAAGLWLGRARVARVDTAAVALGLGVFALFAAPSVFTGHVTLLGYGNEGDGGFHLLLADRIIGHGYDLSGLIPSSAQGTLKNYFDSSYPTGSHTALGVVKVLLDKDVLWLLQPYLVVLTVLSGLGLYATVAPLVESRRIAALISACSVSAGLVYSYANNQQAIKETSALVCIVAAVGVLVPLLKNRPTWRSALPVAVVTGGGLGVLSLALAPWIGIVLLAGFVGRAWRHRAVPRAVAIEAVAFAVPAIVLSITALTRL
ncbi:MAG: hypothetical protein QOF76_2623, partial [Solirubrobacteraceae bacterium]|nr:hypothetical protein [Solirubrobacteraceae bacterium]